MYVVRPAENGLWQIVGDNDLVQFTGTKSQCEDWLDFAENMQPVKLPAPTPSFAKWLASLFRRSGLKTDP